MALRAAIANGNWSLASTWNGGVLPSPGDVVASNGFTVTIDQNINVDSLTNAATSPVTAVPIMTGNTTPSGIVTASSVFSSAYDSWRAFDGSTSSGWITANTVLTGWVAYEFTTAKIITSYVLAGGATGGNSFPRNWTFEGWDGSNWIILHTVTGNTNTSTYTGTFTNTTAYIKYRINITLNNGNTSYTGINEMYLYDLNSVLTTTTAGGGFVVNGTGYTITCTSAITSTISNLAPLITISGSGTNTFNISINVSPGNLSQRYVFITSTGTVNWIGNLIGSTGSGWATLYIASAVTFNMIGDIYSTSSTNFTEVVRITGANYVFNLTGNIGISTGSIGGSGIAFLFIAAIGAINITGNIVSHPTSDFNCISIGVITTINITGTITGNPGRTALSLTNASYVKVIGSLISNGTFAVSSTSASAINIFTGPFISSSSGILPIYVTRMNYFRTLGSYYEFRDSSTNGALPPTAPAPATRLNSPEVGSDLPVVADVRFGTTYGYGSLTGTLRMPHPNQVTYGVAVDNTFGTAVLTAASVWDYLVANITVENSIGMRLKNVATPQTTGSQLAALL